MRGRRLRWGVVGLLASGGAGLLTLSATMHAAFAYGSDEALIMGGSFNPEPDPGYVVDVNTNYIQPLYPNYQPEGLYTPEQFFPVPGYSNLTFDQSVAQGLTDLQDKIGDICGTDPTCGGEHLAVFGYSQSATIATDEMNSLATAANALDPSQLAFILVGDPNNPDGGILERFAGAYIPILDVSFNGATPPDTPYPTDIYTIQYDGVADTPQYPVNVVSDLNALLGYFYLHSDYPTVPVSDYTVTLPTSPDYYTDGGVTHYFEMLTQNLPLLDPLRQIPVVGNPLADLLQPDLRVIVDLGYGDGYANVATPVGLFPQVDPLVVGSELATGAQQGVTAAEVDLGILPSTDLPDAYPYLPLPETPGELTSANLLADVLAPASSGVSTDWIDTALQQLLGDLGGGSALGSTDWLDTLFAGGAMDPSWIFSLFG